jgi:protein-tyrosine-phosphatase
MKVSIVRGGGLAGLVTKTVVDSDSLPAEEAERLLATVEGADFFHLPRKLTTGPPQADRFDYAVTVEDEHREHTVQASEQALPEGVRELVSYVERVPGREEEIGPPGDLPAG